MYPVQLVCFTIWVFINHHFFTCTISLCTSYALQCFLQKYPEWQKNDKFYLPLDFHLSEQLLHCSLSHSLLTSINPFFSAFVFRPSLYPSSFPLIPRLYPPLTYPSAFHHYFICRKWWRTTTLFATWMHVRPWAMPQRSAPIRLAPSPPTAWLWCRLTLVSERQKFLNYIKIKFKSIAL